MSGEQKKTARMDWRTWFKPKTLALAEQDEANGRLVNFEHNESDTWAAGDTAGGFHMEVFDAPNSYSTCIDIVPWNHHKRKHRKSRYDFWGYDVEDEPDEYDGCRTVSHYCSCAIAQSGQLCRHLGSLMIRWEKIRGTFEFTETEE